MSNVIDMSFEAQFQRIHAAAQEMQKYTIQDLMTKAHARKGAALRYCKQYSKEIGAITSPLSNKLATLYKPREML